ncbi:MAG: hypothetical protein M3401_12840 [Actinomycetota bacterium]|nr:hypothetical protein [Actinomycetota bacterium]
MSGKQRLVLLGLAVAAAVAAIIVIPSLGDEESDDETTTVHPQPRATITRGTATTVQKPRPKAPTAKTISVRAGKPVGGVKRLSFEQGQTVRFVVESDVADEVHVHGYDLSKNVAAGGRAVLRFEAKLAGIYEIELEGRGQQIAELRVNP